jgi:prolyl-tRNA editing enzyme YbaK/EbsC (Cys-tRNA(Pro) deacylase)
MIILSIDKVKAYFKQFNMEDKVMEFPTSSATVSEAAQTLNCEEARIAKTMSFKLNDTAILVVMAGDVRIDNHKFKEKFHKKSTMLKGDEVETYTGFPIGGVCPFAPKDGVKVYLDISLKRFDTVYPACGSRNSAIKLTIPELEKYSKAIEWIDISKN